MENTNINKDLVDLVGHIIYDNGVDNEVLIQIIELCGNAMNLQTISDHAKENNLTYNGVKKCRTIRNLFGGEICYR